MGEIQQNFRRLTEGVGAYLLDLVYVIDPKADRETLKLTDIKGSIALASGFDRHAKGYLGDLTFSFEDDSFDREHGMNISAHVGLDNHQLHRVRELTEGGDVTFKSNLSLQITDTESNQVQWQSNLSLQSTLPQSEWLEKLNESGFSNIFLFEVPVPNDTDSERLRASVAQLKNARSKRDEGKYEEAVAACRKVIEALNDGLGVDPGDAENAYIDDPKGMTLDQRELLLRKIAKHYLHPAAHSDSEHLKPKYTRREANLALTVTATLVSAALREESRE